MTVLPHATADQRKLLIGKKELAITMISGRRILHVEVLSCLGREIEVDRDGTRDWIRVADIHEVRSE